MFAMARLLVPRSFAVSRIVLLGAILLAAATTAGGILIAQPLDGPFLALDTGWHDFVTTLRAPLWDGVNAVLNVAGYLGMLILQFLLATTLLIRKRPASAAFCAVAGGVALLATQAAKYVVDRPRPADAVVLTDTGSYPSGHVSATTCFLVVVALLIGRIWTWLVASLGMLSMMFSRTYLSAHWLTDVFGAVCLSAAVVLLIWIGFQNTCVQENTDAPRLLTWRARASRRRRAATRAESAPR